MTQPVHRTNVLILAGIAVGLVLLLYVTPPLLATNHFQSPPSSPLGLVNMIVPLKVFLSAPYSTSARLMNDTLRAQNLLPTTEPYSTLPRFAHIGGETVNPSIFATTGNNAIVDWVLIELRSSGDAKRIVATHAALLQRDGDVVDIDGVSPVTFANYTPGSYYVAIGHRNHLRVMTANPVSLSATSALIDFTNPNTSTSGNYAQATLSGVRALWAGDANTSNQIIYAGPNNDQNAVLTRVLTDPGNPQGNMNYVVPGYGVTDLNLDGKTIAAGPGNEMNVILTTVLSHPSNTTANANYVVQEQPAAGVFVMPTAPQVLRGSTALILNQEFANKPLSEAQKMLRWRQGWPVPLAVPLISAAHETSLAREFSAWQGDGAFISTDASATVPAGHETIVASSRSGNLTSIDGWAQRDLETYEQASPSPGGCVWRSGRTSGKANYEWGRAKTRKKEGSYSAWPAGAPKNGATPVPANSAYPDNLETWWQCELTQTRDVYNLVLEFQLWLELDNVGDSFEIRFYDVPCASANFASHLRGALQWLGTPQGVANAGDDWRNYQLFYPGLKSVESNKLCVELKFSSDQIDGNYPTAQGPWLDEVQLWDYAKPASSTNCQNEDPTVYLANAPGSGNVSKGLVVPPYADDISAGVVDNPDNQLDIAGMVGRLKDADVHWVRLELILPPKTLMRSSVGLGPYGVGQIDLRYYDRLIDMFCANKIAVLGLLDYQTLERRDWNADIVSYTTEFTSTTKQLAGYFNDRIRYWEIWNEPNLAISAMREVDYAKLLIATHDATKAVDAGDKVLFAGLAQATGQVAGNSRGYFTAVSEALRSNGRQNPAPYDIFALHPYPSDEYQENGRVLVDPTHYLKWEQPTTIHKFFTTMIQNGKQDQRLWITEIGWNRAADSTNEVTKACPKVTVTMVNGPQQALYAVQSFNILFRDTAWSSGAPSVDKIFWYQYMDVGIPQAECFTATGAATTPSGPASHLAWGAALARSQVDPQADWWFGLYSGIDWEKNGLIVPNLVQCSFRKYPIATPATVLDCAGMVYLPLVQRGNITAILAAQTNDTTSVVYLPLIQHGPEANSE